MNTTAPDLLVLGRWLCSTTSSTRLIGQRGYWENFERERRGQALITERYLPRLRKFKSNCTQRKSLVLENQLLKWGRRSVGSRAVIIQLILRRIKMSPVLSKIHDGTSGSHLDINKTTDKFRKGFYWPFIIFGDVEEWFRSCEKCAAQTRNGARVRLYNVRFPFERIAVDIADRTNEDGNRYFVVVGDYFTKCVET